MNENNNSKPIQIQIDPIPFKPLFINNEDDNNLNKYKYFGDLKPINGIIKLVQNNN